MLPHILPVTLGVVLTILAIRGKIKGFVAVPQTTVSDDE
jgi:hypothetical protein